MIENERYYVQRQPKHTFLVRELPSPEEEPYQHDRIVHVFPHTESAGEAANAMQRKLDMCSTASWSIRAV